MRERMKSNSPALEDSIMTNRFSFWTVPVVAIALVAAACATPPAPKELKDARAAYARASGSEARKVAPVQLDDAKLALDRAEEAFTDEPTAPKTRDLAYIAERKAQNAIAHANLALARSRQEKAKEERQQLRMELTEQAQARVQKMREELADAKRKSEMSEEELAEYQAKLEKEQARREQIQAMAHEKEMEAQQAQQKAEQAQEKAEEARKRAEAMEKKLKEAQAKLEEFAKVAKEKRGLVITLSGAVLFQSGESNLLPAAQRKLDEVAETLKAHEGKKIVVEGHTDSRGPSGMNQRLSQDRADAVRSYLISRGVESSQISAVGLGESRPIAPNDTAEGRANNRRVEIIIKNDES